MGIIFGRTGSAEPAFTNLSAFSANMTHSLPISIRSVPSYMIAKVPMKEMAPKGNSAFQVLAKYIGVFGQPQNKEQTPMAMTAPVLNTEDETYMSFLLPFEHQSVSDVPEPTDSRIQIEKVESSVIAAVQFSGSYDKTVCQKHFLDMQHFLKEKGLIEREGSVDKEMIVAQYHPPFTLPFMRRNEVWLTLGNDQAKIEALLAASTGTSSTEAEHKDT